MEASSYSKNDIDDVIDRSNLATKEDKTRLRSILENYVDKVKDTPNRVKDFDFSSRFTGEVPFSRASPYRVPVSMMEIAKALIKQLEVEGTIMKVTDYSTAKMCTSSILC